MKMERLQMMPDCPARMTADIASAYMGISQSSFPKRFGAHGVKECGSTLWRARSLTRSLQAILSAAGFRPREGNRHVGRLAVELPSLRRVGKNYYFRRKVGGKTVNHRLPDPEDAGFKEAYGRFATPDTPRLAAPAAGTLAALVREYRASSDYSEIPSITTRQNYLRYLDMILTSMVTVGSTKSDQRTSTRCATP